MVLSGLIKNKKRYLLAQIIYDIFFIVANMLLSATTGAMMNILNIVRAFMVYFNKRSKLAVILLISINLIISLCINTKGFVGLLPLFSTVPYTILLDKCNDKQMKYLLMAVMIPWVIYDIVFKLYIGAVFDVMTIISSCIGLYRLNKSSTKSR
jgi:hypothetical protein